ncbi:MAG: formamidopyrimidine-DNA glycosylase [Myxococcales bacterium]
MPELPDITVYVEALAARAVGASLVGVRLASPFLLRTVEPPLDLATGRRVVSVGRLAKRIDLALEGDLHLVIHLMVAGRLRWETPGAAIPGRVGLAAFDFGTGTLILTEAGTKRRASLHVVRSEGLAALHRGGVEPLECEPQVFWDALTRENHTLKRALTDPRLLSGIGNACSDEILHRARLSPVRLTGTLSPEELRRLREATITVLAEWTARLRHETGGGFPQKVTAFRPEMAVHGRYGQPCPACGTTVQRIRYADNETNYCPRCQTDGRLLADRALSRLLKQDWPRTIAELEERPWAPKPPPEATT